MDDLISRKAAIDALGERPMVWTDDDQYALGERNQYDIDRFAIGTLPPAEVTLCHLGSPCEYQNADIVMPPAQPEQKKGRWKYETMRHLITGEMRTVRICSVCDGGWFRYDMSDGVEEAEPNYCPNCGADMRGEEQDG